MRHYFSKRFHHFKVDNTAFKKNISCIILCECKSGYLVDPLCLLLPQINLINQVYIFISCCSRTSVKHLEISNHVVPTNWKFSVSMATSRNYIFCVLHDQYSSKHNNLKMIIYCNYCASYINLINYSDGSLLFL